MKHNRFTWAALFCSLVCTSTLFAKGNIQSLDGIAAIINDTAITQSQVNEGVQSAKAQLSASNMPLPPADVLRKKVLDQLIARKLQLQVAEQAGIKISDAQVDETIAKIAKENGVSTQELYEKITTQNLTRAQYRKDIREELILQQIQQQQVSSKILMSPEDVKNFMHSKEWQTATASAPSVNEYHVEDMTVLLPEPNTPQDVAAAKAQAEALLSQAKQSTSFSMLATASAKNLQNSDLGWRKLNELPSAFADTIGQMKKGSVIGPIQTGNGFHIVRLIDVRQEKHQAEAMPVPTEKEAAEMVYQRKYTEALNKWISKLRSQAVINTHPG